MFWPTALVLSAFPPSTGQTTSGPSASIKIDFEVFVPAVLIKKLKVGLGVVPDASAGVPIGGVALNDGTVDVIDHRLPKLGMEVVLVALLARMDLDGVTSASDFGNMLGEAHPSSHSPVESRRTPSTASLKSFSIPHLSISPAGMGLPQGSPFRRFFAMRLSLS